MSLGLSGQWRGTSDHGLSCIANLDRRKDHITGRVSVYQTIQIDGIDQAYWTQSTVLANESAPGDVQGRISSPLIFDTNGNLLTDDQLKTIKSKIADFELSTHTDFNGTLKNEHTLDVEWVTTYPSGRTETDHASLERCKNTSSRIVHQDLSWDEFKKFALEQDDRMIYRGQGRRWRLQTSFHKSGRADLIDYLDNEVPELERHINAYTHHEYNVLGSDRSLGSLLNLAQHHGYPTPLLDWTRSPYVAAFFAYENKSVMKRSGKVSIFMFNEGKWSSFAGRYAPMRSPLLLLRTITLPGFGNPRVLPQQSVTMYSNADDIEWVVQFNEGHRGEYLQAISLPVDDRTAALRDLSLMGITWGSLFPGLDGACKELRVRHFGE